MDNEIEFAVYFVGHTGTYKTGISALAQKHYGESFSRRNLPGNWISTENSLPMATQIVKNALVVYDDIKYDSYRDIAHKNKLLERLVRGTANASIRQRKNEYQSNEFNKKPASIPVITAEMVPILAGDSLMERMILVNIKKDDVDLTTIKKLSGPFETGSFTQTSSSFIKFVLDNESKLHSTYAKIKSKYVPIIESCVPNAHARLAPNFATLIASLYTYRCFIFYHKAMSKTQANKMFNNAKDAILDLAIRQHKIKSEFNMANSLNEMFIMAISHESFEFRSLKSNKRLCMNHLYGATKPNNPRSNNDIIWIDKITNDVYINSQFNISRLTKYFNTNFVVQPPTLEKGFWKFLKNSKFLKSHDSKRGHNTIRKVIKGCKYHMYHTNFIIPRK